MPMDLSEDQDSELNLVTVTGPVLLALLGCCEPVLLVTAPACRSFMFSSQFPLLSSLLLLLPDIRHIIYIFLNPDLITGIIYLHLDLWLLNLVIRFLEALQVEQPIMGNHI